MTARDKIKKELDRIKQTSAFDEEWARIHAAEKAKFSGEDTNENAEQVQEQPEKIQEPAPKASKKPGKKKPEEVHEEEVSYVPPDDDLPPQNGNGTDLTPAEQDTEGYKSEIARQLFDVPRNKILQRTELPRRMILPMSMMKTSIFLTQAYHPGKETGPEHWMHEYGYLMLSAGRKVRMEGMAAFQPNPEGGSSENINF